MYNEERRGNSLTEINCAVSLDKMLLLVVFVAFFLKGNYMFPMDSEPKCTSKFDFEEKVLEKVIRMEFTMETIQENVREDVTKFNKEIEQFRTELRNMLTKVDDAVTELKSQFTTMEKSSKAKLADIIAEFERTQNATNSYYKQWGEAAEDKLNGIQQDAEANLMKLKDLAVKPDVVFHVKDISAQPSAGNVVKFTTSVTNTDNVFNMDTGVFTAPRDGTYWFAGQICSNVNKYMSPSIFIGETVVNRVFTRGIGDQDCATVTAVVILHAGDTATLKAGPYMDHSPVWEDARYNINTFMGALIN